MLTPNPKGLGEILNYCKIGNKEVEETLGNESQESHLHVYIFIGILNQFIQSFGGVTSWFDKNNFFFWNALVAKRVQRFIKGDEF